MKRRNFVKNSTLFAGALAFTPVTSIFGRNNQIDDWASNPELPALDPEVTEHYVKFSREFFTDLPEKARNHHALQNEILPAKTIGYSYHKKGYDLTFLNRNGNKVSFISKEGRSYTVITNV